MIIFCGSFLFFPVLFGGISIEKFILVQVLSTSLGVICAFLILLSGKLLIKEKFRFSFFWKRVFVKRIALCNDCSINVCPFQAGWIFIKKNSS